MINDACEMGMSHDAMVDLLHSAGVAYLRRVLMVKGIGGLLLLKFADPLKIEVAL